MPLRRQRVAGCAGSASGVEHAEGEALCAVQLALTAEELESGVAGAQVGVDAEGIVGRVVAARGGQLGLQ